MEGLAQSWYPLCSFIIESKPRVWSIGPLSGPQATMAAAGSPFQSWDLMAYLLTLKVQCLDTVLLGALFRVREVMLCGSGDFQGQHLPVSP